MSGISVHTTQCPKIPLHCSSHTFAAVIYFAVSCLWEVLLFLYYSFFFFSAYTQTISCKKPHHPSPAHLLKLDSNSVLHAKPCKAKFWFVIHIWTATSHRYTKLFFWFRICDSFAKKRPVPTITLQLQRCHLCPVFYTTILPVTLPYLPAAWFFIYFTA